MRTYHKSFHNCLRGFFENKCTSFVGKRTSSINENCASFCQREADPFEVVGFLTMHAMMHMRVLGYQLLAQANGDAKSLIYNYVFVYVGAW